MSKLCPCTVGNHVSAALFNLRNVKKLNDDTPEEASPATVLSRRVEHNNSMYHESPWLYQVTFRLENGETKDLQATEDSYATFKEGAQGTLTWQSEKILSFETTP